MGLDERQHPQHATEPESRHVFAAYVVTDAVACLADVNSHNARRTSVAAATAASDDSALLLLPVRLSGCVPEFDPVVSRLFPMMV